MKIIIATQNGAASGTTENTILVASNFSCVLPVHFFVVQNCVAVVLLRSILCCRTFHLGSVLVLPSPVMSRTSCIFAANHNFSSFGVGRRIYLARATNVGFRQMMQFWNPLIMRYQA